MTIRVGLFFGALNGAMLGLAAFVFVIPPLWFLVLKGVRNRMLSRTFASR